jgi:hypothetical protein
LKSNLQQVVNTLVLAFVNDTFGRFMGPDANHYMKSRIIFEAMAVGSIDTGAAYLAYNTDEVCGAASLWFPPGEKPPEDAMMAALGEAVFPERQETVARVFETMKSFTQKSLIGILPFSALMRIFRVKALVRHCLNIPWRYATVQGRPPTWSHQIRRRFQFMNVIALKSWTKSELVTAQC